MESMLVKWNGKVFRYVFFFMDVFSWYYWFILLERNKSGLIVVALLIIYKEYGFFCVF